MSVTILDIARESGKSYPTVSRALNDHPKISDKTKREIRAVAERLGYRPSFAGTALKKGRTGILAVIVPDLGDPFYAEFIRYFKQAALEYDIVVYDYEENPQLERKYLERMLGGYCDGVAAFITSLDHTHDLVAKLWRTRVPLTLIGTPHTDLPEAGYDWATVSTVDSIRKILQHLRRNGKKKAVKLIGPLPDEIRQQLTAIYGKLSVELYAVESPPTDQARGGLDAGREILKKFPETDIILTQTGYQAYGLLLAAREAGRDIPGDLAVVINDNSWINRYAAVPLYAVDQQLETLSAEVFRMLEHRIKSPEWPAPQRYTQPSRAIIPE